ncbi:MAG: hypothetical protein Q9202_002929 [Teloschistes flavicans]
MASQEAPHNRKERRARAKQGQDSVDIPLARPKQQAPKGKTLLELAEERQLLQRSKNDSPPSFTTSRINPDGSVTEVPETKDPSSTPYLDVFLYTTSLTLLHFTLTLLVHHQYATEQETPVSNHPIQDARTSNIFPSALTTQMIFVSILQQQDPTHLHRLAPVDVEHFLTQWYGDEDFEHWTWIGCTFDHKYVEAAFDRLPNGHGVESERVEQEALLEFVKRTHEEEMERRSEYRKSKGPIAADAYIKGFQTRIDHELERLRWIMERRLNDD